MKVTHYSALGFSLGTLVDRERGILEGLRPLAVQANPDLSDEQLLSAYRSIALDLSSTATVVTAVLFMGSCTSVWLTNCIPLLTGIKVLLSVAPLIFGLYSKTFQVRFST